MKSFANISCEESLIDAVNNGNRDVIEDLLQRYEFSEIALEDAAWLASQFPRWRLVVLLAVAGIREAGIKKLAKEAKKQGGISLAKWFLGEVC